MNPIVITMGKSDFQYQVSDLGQISRDEVTVAISTTVIDTGTVMGVVTSSGQYAPYNPTATDGTETVVAILGRGVNTTTTAQKSVVTARLAEVSKTELVFVGTVTAQQKETAYTSLALKNIIVRG